jgi:Tfp pilus assembly PilM family ATPase
MLTFLKKHVYPAGIDVTADGLKIAQLAFDGTYRYVQATGSESMPEDIQYGTAAWQKWIAATAKKIMKDGAFKGSNVITAMPPQDVFIDEVTVPKVAASNPEQAAFKKVSPKLPFDPQQAMIQYIVADLGINSDQVNVLVLATDRKIVERHLAIYEKAGLEIKGIAVWPLVMTNTYIKFFSRRKSEASIIAMLVDVAVDTSKIIICRGPDLLFARAIPVGSVHINQGQMVQRLVSEMEACCHYFESVASSQHIERLLFLSGRSVDASFCDKMAEFAAKMQIPAQIGDVLAAVESKESSAVDRRDSSVDWTTAFGLSLTGADD